MKRSQINEMCAEAKGVFEKCGWTLPPEPRWDFTDFGKNDIANAALVLVNLAEESKDINLRSGDSLGIAAEGDIGMGRDKKREDKAP